MNRLPFQMSPLLKLQVHVTGGLSLCRKHNVKVSRFRHVDNSVYILSNWSCIATVAQKLMSWNRKCFSWVSCCYLDKINFNKVVYFIIPVNIRSAIKVRTIFTLFKFKKSKYVYSNRPTIIIFRTLHFTLLHPRKFALRPYWNRWRQVSSNKRAFLHKSAIVFSRALVSRVTSFQNSIRISCSPHSR